MMTRIFQSALDAIARRPLIWSIGCVVWLGLLVWVSMRIPPPDQSQAFPQQDKVLHFVFFMGGGFVFAGVLHLLTTLRGAWLAISTVLILSALGAADEYHQQFVPGRDGLSLADWVADSTGALAGAVLLIHAGPLLSRRFAGPA